MSHVVLDESSQPFPRALVPFEILALHPSYSVGCMTCRRKVTNVSNQLESQLQDETRIDNNVYLQIWRTDQEHTRTRWTVATFFISISFAILGFSFQVKLVPPEPSVIRIAGLFIYWFAFALFWHHYRFNKFLRGYLVELETSGRATLDIQSKALLSSAANKGLSTIRLLAYFGLIYALGVVALWFLGF
jgi:hypothetical protein